MGAGLAKRRNDSRNPSGRPIRPLKTQSDPKGVTSQKNPRSFWSRKTDAGFGRGELGPKNLACPKKGA